MTTTEPERETRKVQLAGGTTYTVSLPKKWATEHGIEAGTAVYLEPHSDGSLVMHPKQPRDDQPKQTRVSVDAIDETGLARTIRALYATGFDRIVFVAADGLDSDHRRAVRTAARKLVGVEVLEESTTEIVVKSVLDASHVSIRQSLVRLRSVTLDMFRDATEALVEHDPERARRVLDLENEADRTFALISRHFQRTLASFDEIDLLGLDRPTVFEYYVTARQLERIADHAETIASIVARADRALTPDIAADIDRLAAESEAVVGDAVEAVLGGASTDLAFDVFDRCEEIQATVAELDRRLYDSGGPDDYWVVSVVDRLGHVADRASTIGEVTIQSAARRGELP